MKVDQDWTNVWPTAASFKWSVIPFPVRQGAVFVSMFIDIKNKECQMKLFTMPVYMLHHFYFSYFLPHFNLAKNRNIVCFITNSYKRRN